jgi:prepilin-type N-terminal cleavage/methylation domain-containing protein
MRTRTRAGFTLVELMVAMALTLFVMVILTQAFVTSLDTFSAMKGLGDMQVNLRTAETMLRNDLASDHFEGKRRLSDVDAQGNPMIVSQPAQAGFFAVRRTSSAVFPPTPVPPPPYYLFEGNDPSGLPSYLATDHVLHMTNKRKGNRQESFYSATLLDGTVPPAGPSPALTAFFSVPTAYDINPNTQLPYATWTPPYPPPPGNALNQANYSSQWAEVMYYLLRTGSTEEPSNPNSVLGTPTWGLYRAQFVMVPDGTNLTSPALAPGLEGSTFAQIACNRPGAGMTLVFFSPMDAAKGNRTLDIGNFNPATNTRVLRLDPSGAIIRETLVCPNVISFQVQVMQVGSNAFDDMIPGALGAPFFYDTARFGVAGYTPNGLKGIQVTVRVWDNKTRQTRQATVVQDL